jgi:Cytochrome C oxidase, cbb3-type, subunit III
MLRLRLVKSLVVTLAGLTLPIACGQNSLGDPTGSTCPSSSTLTYDSFGKAFFDTNCNSCHGKTQSPSFGTQEQIQANSADIDRAAASGPKATNTYMPDGADVSDADRQKLGEWLACGAP